jgi:hypothetical protein
MIRGVTDLELDAIMNAAAPLAPGQRDVFVRAVILELERSEPGANQPLPSDIHGPARPPNEPAALADANGVRTYP